jgi:phosphoribosylaminoimidazolecarboxamide formyltransferase/IMP cyclohydrolase
MTGGQVEVTSDTDTGSRLRLRSALIALSDRSHSEVLTQALNAAGVEVYATTGTAAYLKGLGLSVRPAEELTRSGEFLGGRVKTLTPDLFGAILARRDNPDHLRDLEARGIRPLDLVAVTLYPFEELSEDASWDEAMEKIDIGGVSLLRAAAKNHSHVAVLSSPDQYDQLCASLEAGGPTLAERRRWATAAIERTAEYDSHIARFFQSRGDDELPAIWLGAQRRSRGLRYGENPHQEAAIYAAAGKDPWWISGALHEGKELSFNNLLDLQVAYRLVGEFVPPACVIVKHNEPSSVGLGDDPAAAFEKAMAGDPVSAYGGVVGFNREVDVDAARIMSKHFLECVGAPGYRQEAAEKLTGKKRLRVVRMPSELWEKGGLDTRGMKDGMLVQRVRPDAGEIQLEVVTRRAPTPAEMEALHFAWTVVASARSNAVVIARADTSLGVGSGQTARVDALNVALMKARRSGLDVEGSVLASDGFFPFADWVEIAREAGITACIQPGGSIRDPDSIAACDDAGLAMVFTGRRQFRH